MTKKFGDNSASYPAEMRTQNWPLCCGAKVLSGFKNVGNISEEELITQINDICDNYTPDHQIYGGETINPALTFLTLNQGQMTSPKVMNAIKEAGFVHFASGTGRNAAQGFFVRDKSKNFKPAGAWAAPIVVQAA